MGKQQSDTYSRFIFEEAISEHMAVPSTQHSNRLLHTLEISRLLKLSRSIRTSEIMTETNRPYHLIIRKTSQQHLQWRPNALNMLSGLKKETGMGAIGLYSWHGHHPITFRLDRVLMMVTKLTAITNNGLITLSQEPVC